MTTSVLLAPTPPARPDPMDRARRHIDDNLLEPITLGEVSDHVGLSPYHFTRQFSARFGIAPMTYLRQRRLAAAASQLCRARPPTLITLALDHGFNSQEGFTRAFKRAFGVTPGLYKRSGARPLLMEPTMTTDPQTDSTDLSTSNLPAWKDGLRLVGLSAEFTDQTKAGIPALWGRLEPRLPLAGQVGGTYGACIGGDQSGRIRYMAAVALAPDAVIPPDLEVLDVSARDYLVFRQTMHGGPLHPQMQHAAREIWGRRVPESGFTLAKAPDLEVYCEGFQAGRAGDWVEWWIPVETQGA